MALNYTLSFVSVVNPVISTLKTQQSSGGNTELALCLQQALCFESASPTETSVKLVELLVCKGRKARWSDVRSVTVTTGLISRTLCLDLHYTQLLNAGASSVSISSKMLFDE